MDTLAAILKSTVTALLVTVWYSLPVSAEVTGERLDELFASLATPGAESNWETIEQEIVTEWSKSGSAAMDFLLLRGRQALADGDFPAAIEHLTALVDHAPDFAEGWNARATAYFRAGMYGPALADIARTLTLNPRHFGALSGFGIILEELDRPKDALEIYQQVIAIHPHRPNLNEAIERLDKSLGGARL